MKKELKEGDRIRLAYLNSILPKDRGKMATFIHYSSNKNFPYKIHIDGHHSNTLLSRDEFEIVQNPFDLWK